MAPVPVPLLNSLAIEARRGRGVRGGEGKCAQHHRGLFTAELSSGLGVSDLTAWSS